MIRKDLDFFAELGVKLEIERGFARIRRDDELARTPFDEKRKIGKEQKATIARYAVEAEIQPGDTLLLDSGTQMELFVKELTKLRRTRIRVLSEACFPQHFMPYDGIDYVQLGGLLNRRAVVFADGVDNLETKGFFRKSNDKFLEEFFRDGRQAKAVITGTGFDENGGLLVNSKIIIDYKRSIINTSSEVIILIDPSKFNTPADHTVTHCGFSAEGGWLKSEKPATIIVHRPIEDKKDEYTFFDPDALGDKEIPIDGSLKEDYPGIRVFRTTLMP